MTFTQNDSAYVYAITEVKQELEEEPWMVEECPEVGVKFMNMLEHSTRAQLQDLTEADFVREFQNYPRHVATTLFRTFLADDIFGLTERYRRRMEPVIDGVLTLALFVDAGTEETGRRRRWPWKELHSCNFSEWEAVETLNIILGGLTCVDVDPLVAFVCNRFPKLQRLDVSFNMFTDADLEAIRAKVKIEVTKRYKACCSGLDKILDRFTHYCRATLKDYSTQVSQI